jgi:hypothetical protein
VEQPRRSEVARSLVARRVPKSLHFLHQILPLHLLGITNLSLGLLGSGLFYGETDKILRMEQKPIRCQDPPTLILTDKGREIELETYADVVSELGKNLSGYGSQKIRTPTDLVILISKLEAQIVDLKKFANQWQEVLSEQRAAGFLDENNLIREEVYGNCTVGTGNGCSWTRTVETSFHFSYQCDKCRRTAVVPRPNA